VNGFPYWAPPDDDGPPPEDNKTLGSATNPLAIFEERVAEYSFSYVNVFFLECLLEKCVALTEQVASSKSTKMHKYANVKMPRQ